MGGCRPSTVWSNNPRAGFSGRPRQSWDRCGSKIDAPWQHFGTPPVNLVSERHCGDVAVSSSNRTFRLQPQMIHVVEIRFAGENFRTLLLRVRGWLNTENAWPSDALRLDWEITLAGLCRATGAPVAYERTRGGGRSLRPSHSRSRSSRNTMANQLSAGRGRKYFVNPRRHRLDAR